MCINVTFQNGFCYRSTSINTPHPSSVDSSCSCWFGLPCGITYNNSFTIKKWFDITANPYRCINLSNDGIWFAPILQESFYRQIWINVLTCYTYLAFSLSSWNYPSKKARIKVRIKNNFYCVFHYP